MNTIKLTSQEVAQRYLLLCRSTRVSMNVKTIGHDIEKGIGALDNILVHDLRDLSRKGSPDDFSDIYFELKSELERLREFCAYPPLAKKFIVAFGGGFSAGKSSLINAVLGKKLLVTEVDPTTSLPTYLLKGAADGLSALNFFGHRIVLNEDEFMSLTHDEVSRFGSNVSRLLRAAFITRADFAWDNISIIDTPGYTKFEEGVQSDRTDEHLARTQLNAAQGVVWVIDARQGGITEEDVAFLNGLQRDIHLFIAVSRADQKTAQDIPLIIDGIKATLNERNIPFVAVVPVSARKTQVWPLKSLLDQLDKWNTQSRELRFLHNFKVQFSRYENFLSESEHKALRNLNRLNRILIVSDNKDAQDDTEELKQSAQNDLKNIRLHKKEIESIRERFFSQLKLVGGLVKINFSEKSEEQESSSAKKIDVLELITSHRDAQKYRIPDEPQVLHQLMQKDKEQCLVELLGDPLDKLLVTHTAANLDEHSKIMYARMLTLLLTTCDEISPEKSLMLRTLLRKQGFEDIRVNLFEDVRNFSINDLIECSRIFIHNKLEKSIILDGLVLCSFGGVLTTRQVHIFSELANILGVHEDLKISLVNLVRHVLGLIEMEPNSNIDLNPFAVWNVFLPHSDKGRRIKIAATAELPIFLQKRFVVDVEEDVISSMAKNTCLTTDLMSELILTGSQGVKKALASNPLVPEKLQIQLFNSNLDDVKAALAANVSLIGGLQDTLKSDSSWRVRAALAANPSVNNKILEVLITDGDSDVKAAVAKNPEISIKFMEELFNSDNRSVKLGLAENVRIPESLQVNFLNDSDEVIRSRLARNPSISEGVQNKLATDRKSVRMALAKNPQLKIGVQKNLLSSSDVDLMVTLHQNTSVADEIKIKIKNSISKDDLSERRKLYKEKMIESLNLSQETMRARLAWSEYALKQFQDRGWFSSWSQSECDQMERRADSLERKGRELDGELSDLNQILDLLEIVLAVPVQATKPAPVAAPAAAVAEPAEPAAPPLCQQPGDILCAGSGFPELVLLPGGSFQMGSTQGSDEQPVHTVNVASFALGKYPVTQAQWKKVMGSNPSCFSNGGDQCPVEQVSWDDAQAFIQKLNQQTGHIYRLPSEAEWEYACRAGGAALWCFGDDESQLTQYAWYSDNSGNKTHPVGEKKANAFGLHDMHGNVWEWCEDKWHGDYQGAPSDGRAWVDGESSGRVTRGGSWSDYARGSRAARRSLNSSDFRKFFNGFRLARTAP